MKLESIRDIIVVLVTCMNEDDPKKNKGARVATTFSHYKSGDFSRHSRAANSAICSRTWPKFELIRDVVVVLVIFKNEEDPIKNEVARGATTFSPF